MKIAIVGTGISGLVAAYRLQHGHDITVFEADTRPGGHTATVDVQLDGRDYAIDTGFIVFNDWTYPNFIRIMDELGVASRESDMSFAVNCLQTGLAYAGVNGRFALYNSLFAQRRRLFSPRFVGMLLDILRFNRQATADVLNNSIPDVTVSEYVARHQLGDMFRDYYLVPMSSAIWSTPFRDMLQFPMPFMLPFMHAHGLISVHNRPKWRTLVGGSRAYLEPIMAGFRDQVKLNTAVTRLQPEAEGVRLFTGDGEALFDHVILACHSDQALALLAEPSVAEAEVLSAIRYQANDVVLHTDSTLLSDNLLARASWNYRMDQDREGLPRVTYDMNRLMGIDAPHHFLVSLNDTDAIAPSSILQQFSYAHPVFTPEGARAQQRWAEVNGQRGLWFCGAWWGKGFHEDGVNSALRVVDAIQSR